MNRRGSDRRPGRIARLGAWLGLLSALGLAGNASGCSTSSKDICDLKCDCEGCSTEQYDDCIADIEDTMVTADGLGCADQYSEWLSCVEAEVECRGGETFAWDGCDIEEEALSACGGTDSCSAAAKKLCDECNFSCAEPDPASCTGQYECLSKCIVNASCTEIASATSGSSYSICLDGC